MDKFKSYVPHIVAVILFLGITFTYFSPVIQNKQLQQHDVLTFKGSVQEIEDFRENNDGEEALWTNSMFGGMPAYLISVKYPYNIFSKIHYYLGSLPPPASFLFLLLLGFYITLLAFKVDPYLSIAGAIAFAFSSYFLIIIGAGHNTKTVAIAYMAPLIGGIVMAYRRKLFLGALLFAFFFALQLVVNHLQITYYTLLTILIYGIFELYNSIKEKTLPKFIKTTALLIAVGIIAIGTNAGKLWNIYDYGKDSIRGKSELSSDAENKTSGLDKDYATAWSYGKAETFTLLVPNFMGGASGGELPKGSATHKFITKTSGVSYANQAIKQMPTYWGTQPMTSGPVYIGAIIFFLFVLGLLIVKGHIKWWLLAATILSIMLAWGKNFMGLTDFFLDYFPGYNKFRAVSMTLVIAEFTMPLLAILAIKQIIDEKISKIEFLKALKISLGAVGGLLLIFALMPSMFFDFSAKSDEQYLAQGAVDFVNALRDDRESLLQKDAFRSLAFILISVVVLLAFMYKKISKTVLYISFTVLFIADGWTVAKRYLNNDSFVSKRKAETPFSPTSADMQIMQDKSLSYRVYNASVSTFNDASTSYYHKSIGGYHGAKLRRFQELVDFHISKQNMAVLNMFNTKYFIVPTKEQGVVVQQNPEALGNAWFISDYKLVKNADEEIVALTDFNPSQTAIIDDRFKSELEGFKNTDTNGSILLEEYQPNYLKYKSNASSEKLAVFSEVYYAKGWNAYINGELKPHFRVNYLLRAMRVPSGENIIEFKFEPSSYATGNNIELISSILMLLMLGGIGFLEIKSRKIN